MRFIEVAQFIVMACIYLNSAQGFLSPFRMLPNRHRHTKLPLSNNEVEYTFQVKVPGEVVRAIEQIGSNAANINQDLNNLKPNIDFGGLLASIPETVTVTSLSSFLLPLVTIIGVFLFGWMKNLSDQASPFTEGAAVYEPERMEEFYKQRPWLVLTRLLRIVWLTASFNINLLLDWKFNALQQNERDRARQVTNIISQLGPTFVKLGQALSIRTDLISDTYAEELRSLQDSVPPFDDAHAKSIICSELQISNLKEKFRSISDKPIASASIGQVYKAELYDGREVAVKVQRPAILSSIGLDLYILRLIAPLQARINNLISGSPTESSDLELAYSLVDEWGRGLVGEVDYKQEGENTMQFIEAMKKRELDAVTAPYVHMELSTSKILVTEWMYGTRLDRDSSKDIPRLCGLALNAYLTMLLDTGVLHCDPHPGNLLRTRDGRLCILDWGMTLTLPQDLQYGLLEFIAHVNAGDFDQLPEDFVKLGASPADRIDEVRNSGIPQGFAFIMKQLGKGGGPMQITDNLRTEFKARYGDVSDLELTKRANDEMLELRQLKDSAPMDVNGMAGLMEMMSKKNREIFKLPTYMLYVVRAFSTLEGIGLSIDPNYAILQECYPYLAKRLMTDDSPRSRAALRNMIYKDGRLKTDKLIEFSDGFTSYTASTAHVDRDGEGIKKAQEALADLILDREGNMMQDLLLEGAAEMADSIVRVGLDQMKGSPGGQLIKFALKTPKAFVDAFVPNELKPLLLPLSLPYDISKALINLAEKDERDEGNIQSLKILWGGLEPRIRQQIRELAVSSLDEAENRNRGTVLIPLSLVDSKAIRERLGQARRLNERIPVVLRLTRKLGASVLSTVSERMEAKSHVPGEGGDLDYELELLFAEQLGSLSSATAKGLANVLDLDVNRRKTK